MSATSRVLVVDDSAFMRQIICDLIAEDSQFTIIGTASNGREAIAAVELHKPDVITMDLEMPEMNGLEALERIMRFYPVPIIMMSSISDDGTRETIKALQNGAFDFIRKPSGPLSPDIRAVGEQLLEKLRIAVLTKLHSKMYAADRQPGLPLKRKALAAPKAAKPGTRLPNSEPDIKPVGESARLKGDDPPSIVTPSTSAKRAKTPAMQPDKAEALTVSLTQRPAVNAAKQAESKTTPSAKSPKTAAKPKASQAFQHLVAIGTSTGGPRALHEVITRLPKDFPAPVLVVQHMPPKFTRSLAQRLDTFSALQVTEAEQGERVCAGVVYIAPGGYHMQLAKDGGGFFIRLTEETPRNGHRPSVDILFESCTAYPELRRHAVIMTGMGNDGVKGMKALNDSGAESAIAEAEESCVVYGMPRSAVEAGVAKDVIPLKGIAPALSQAVRQ